MGGQGGYQLDKKKDWPLVFNFCTKAVLALECQTRGQLVSPAYGWEKKIGHLSLTSLNQSDSVLRLRN